MRIALTACISMGLSAFATYGAFAQVLEKPGDYPSRTITMIVPFGTGGGSDLVARAMSQELKEIMGVSFQIVNKPGAGGLASLPDFMIAKPDGYTILQHTDGLVTGFASGISSVEPGVDAIPICTAQVAFSMMLINPEDTRFSDWPSLVEYAKGSGESLRVATSSGVGSHEHVSTVQVAESAGIKMDVVPFGDPGERVAAILGGHIDVLFDQPDSAMAYVNEGQLVPVLVLLKETPEALGDIPSLTDMGLDFEPTVKTRGFFVPGGTPEPIVDYLASACDAAYNTDRFLKFNVDTYSHLARSFYNAEETSELFDGMLATYTELFTELGIKK